MAFLRKHRRRYWLVHNFRVDGKVRQERLYGFDLHADVNCEISRAQQTVAARYPDQIASTWVEPVRSQLKQLQQESRRQYGDDQIRQIRQQIATLVQAVDGCQAPQEDKNRLIWDCMGQLQQCLRQDSSALQGTSMPKVYTTPSGTLCLTCPDAQHSITTLGGGFYVAQHGVYHVCAKPSPPDAVAAYAVNVSHHAPATLVSLRNGRDLWIECLVCHARFNDISCLTQHAPVNLPRQTITRFERFCREHKAGEACYILIRYGGGAIVRRHGIIQAIDYAGQKVQVAVSHAIISRIYQRNFAKVYFGTLEVRLNDVQHKRIASDGKAHPRHLCDDWYLLDDTPDTRILLRQIGVHY